MSGPDKTGGGTRHDALAGIRVLDFTTMIAGPMCTRTLADAGAEVIKVEAPGGEVMRQRPPFRGGVATYWASLNMGKRSLVLDLQTEEGRANARKLAARCDVVVENFRPGVMKRLGLDYETLAADNPRLVYCSISGFGQDGPSAQMPAYAPVIHAASGYEDTFTRYQSDASKPANNGIFVADVLVAVHAGSAIQLALFDRERTGRGQFVDVALMDSMLGLLIYEVQAAQFPPDRQRKVYQPVRANDGFVIVAAITPRNLEAMFEVIGHAPGLTDPRFSSVAAREDNWQAMFNLLEAWTSQRSALECEEKMLAAGVPCSRYRTVAEAMADVQSLHRGVMQTVGEPGATFQVVNAPYRFSDARMQVRDAIPHLGQDTQSILDELASPAPSADDTGRRTHGGR